MISMSGWLVFDPVLTCKEETASGGSRNLLLRVKWCLTFWSIWLQVNELKSQFLFKNRLLKMQRDDTSVSMAHLLVAFLLDTLTLLVQRKVRYFLVFWEWLNWELYCHVSENKLTLNWEPYCHVSEKKLTFNWELYCHVSEKTLTVIKSFCSYCSLYCE